MAKQSTTTLKTYFNTGDKPTESNFGDFIESSTQTAVSAATTVSGSSAEQDTFVSAITIPAGSVITNLFIIATTALSCTSGDAGHKIGTAADGAEISAADTDSLIDGTTALAIKKGIAMDSAMHVGLGGDDAIAMVAGSGYDSSARDIHFTITSDQVDLAGAVICGVQYAQVI